MTKSSKIKRDRWTPGEVNKLKALYSRLDLDSTEIAQAMGRTVYSVTKKASRLGIAMDRPKNQFYQYDKAPEYDPKSCSCLGTFTLPTACMNECKKAFECLNLWADKTGQAGVIK